MSALMQRAACTRLARRCPADQSSGCTVPGLNGASDTIVPAKGCVLSYDSDTVRLRCQHGAAARAAGRAERAGRRHAAPLRSQSELDGASYRAGAAPSPPPSPAHAPRLPALKISVIGTIPPPSALLAEPQRRLCDVGRLGDLCRREVSGPARRWSAAPGWAGRDDGTGSSPSALLAPSRYVLHALHALLEAMPSTMRLACLPPHLLPPWQVEPEQLCADAIHPRCSAHPR